MNRISLSFRSLGLESRTVQYGLLAVIVAIAAGLRLVKLGEWSFWFDEVATVNRTVVHLSSLEAIFSRPLPVGMWMPVSLISTGFVFDVMGVNEFSARLIPAVVGVLTVPVIYVLVKRMYGVGTGLLSAAILAVSPWHLFWSQNARFYTSLMLFSMVAMLSFFYGFERDRPSYIFVGYAALYIATSERLTALLTLPAVLAYLLVLFILAPDRSLQVRKKTMIVFLAPMVLFAMFELFLLLMTGSSFVHNAVEVFSLHRGPSPVHLLYRIVANIGIAVVVAGAFGGLFLVLAGSRAGIFLTSYATVPILVLLIANPFMLTEDRYAFIVLPAWLILAAIAVREVSVRTEELKNRRLLLAILPLLLVSTGLFQDLRYFQLDQGGRLDWEGAVRFISSHRSEGDVVASYWPQLTDYYMEEDTVSMQTMEVSHVVDADDRYWFLIDDYAVWSAHSVSSWVQEECDLRMTNQLRLEKRHTLSVYSCDPIRTNASN